MTISQMYRLSVWLNILLGLCIAGFLGMRAVESAFRKDAIVFSSTSPNGRWQCEITDVCPKSAQYVFVFSVRPTSGLPLSGTQYVTTLTVHQSVMSHTSGLTPA